MDELPDWRVPALMALIFGSILGGIVYEGVIVVTREIPVVMN